MTQVHLYIKQELIDKLTEKLNDEHEYPPSRSKLFRSWLEAYLAGKLRVED